MMDGAKRRKEILLRPINGMLDLKDKTGNLVAFFELALMEATLLISFVACNNSSVD